ncbi:MAG: hypothetical protein ACK5M1_04545 [Xanthomarina gelatinilytica]|uniref:hypothetical protein n=1 Tax=Xanthomarina gelatinilytica TaxID=1137281 RepID=UPI003A83BC33
MHWLKLKAGALQLTLFIAVVIALLLSAFILLVHTHKKFQVQTDFVIETARNTDKGFDYAFQNRVPLNDTLQIQLTEEPNRAVKIHRDYWGVFEKILSISQTKNKRFTKTALVGAKQSGDNRTALYVQDNNKPLVLVGNTKIEGIAYIPKQGVKSGTISGQSYYGSQLIYGQTKTSSTLPKVASEIISQIKSIENQISKTSQSQFMEFKDGKSYKNSFKKPVKVIFSNSNINLNSIQLTGHILVQSKTRIVVEATSVLKDVVLIAPEIEIKNNVKGYFQAIASKSIRVGSNVHLEYPSALVLNEKQLGYQQGAINNNHLETSFIYIEENAVIKGLVLFLGEEKTNNYKAQIELNENATLYGELYCNQNTELKGTVYGTVFTNNFIANQSGSVYQNHIYNGNIIINKLPEEYVGLSFNGSKKEILKWLY